MCEWTPYSCHTWLVPLGEISAAEAGGAVGHLARLGAEVAGGDPVGALRGGAAAGGAARSLYP